MHFIASFLGDRKSRCVVKIWELCGAKAMLNASESTDMKFIILNKPIEKRKVNCI